MTHRMPRGSMLALLLAALMTGASGMAGPVLAASDVRFSALPFLNLANQIFGEQTVLDTVETFTGQAAQLTSGSDGRVTVLMVGTDHRDGDRNGERTDTIMVMSINTANKQISAASIPRDTAKVPIAPSLGGGVFQTKINGMFKWFKKNSGGNRNVAMEKLRIEIEYLLATPIDYVAWIRFDGFDALVDEAGGIETTIPAQIRDPKYIDKPGWPVGAKFNADNSVVLGGAAADRCYGGYPKPVTNWSDANVPPCFRALVYVRSRKGKVGTSANNDFKRISRQQAFIYDAIRQLRNSLSTTQDVRVKANNIPTNFYTTIPIGSASDGVALYNLAQGATLPYRVVFKPTIYATKVNSHYELKLSAVRAWCDQYMGPA